MFGALAAAGIGAAAKFGLDYAKGHASNQLYASRIRDQAKVQYAYAQRYAENSPSWNVKGLREAGLNPILAVSNGVNLGANMPNLSSSSPDMDSGSAPDLAGIIQNKQRLDIDRENSASSRISADAQATSAGADMIRAQADSALKSAQTAEVLQRTKLEGKGGGYKTDTINDIVRGIKDYNSSVRESQERESRQYLYHSPKDFRSTLSPSERASYDAIEKQYGKGSAREMSKHFREKEDDHYYNRQRQRNRILSY